MQVHLLLFGPPRLAHGGGMVALTFERRSQLLVHLALRRSRMARSDLATLLWPRAQLEQAHANLRKTLFRIRELPWASAVTAQDQALGFDGTSDVDEFEAAIAQRRWADALDLGGAPLLAGFDDDDSEPWSRWLRAERERLHAAWLAAGRECLAVAADPAQQLTLSSRLLGVDPLDESAVRAQMLAHAQQGRPERAREAYHTYTERLAQDIGTTPQAELQTLHESLGTHNPVAAPAVGAPRIVGRASERRAAQARLEGDCRLLTLLGPGGVGKSCFARYLLSELAPRYTDGAAWIPLDDVDSPDAIGVRLARELALPLSGGDPSQAAIAFLRGRRMLLVFDNFEQLHGAAPQLQALLDACPCVQLVVTSRVRLGLAAEHLLPLDGLPCPDAEDADCLESFDAAQLFVRAARAVEPALNPAAEAGAIAEICRLVDGLPLALEIAASWTRVLPCQAIAAELRQGMDLLTETNAALPARHASMAAVFEQSWRRLRPAERAAWARLTVFHGGFTLDAARAVTGATLPVLAALTDHSLLRKAGTRVDLHPLLRQLAASRLTDDERSASCHAHSAHYLRWLAPLRARLDAGDKQELQQLDVEFENVRAAWRWASQHGPVDALRSAALPLMRFSELRGRHLEGLALLREAAAGIGATEARLRPLLDAAMSNIEMRLDRYAEAHALAERALRAARAARDDDARLQCSKVLGACEFEFGRLLRARRRYRQALALASAAVNPIDAAGMLMNIAMVDKDLGRFDSARQLYMQALVEQRKLNDAPGEAMCLTNLAVLEYTLEQAAPCIAHLESALALCERHALTSLQMVVLANLADVLVHCGDAAGVQRYGHRALEFASQIGNQAMESTVQLSLAQIALQHRDLSTARAWLRAAVENAIAAGHTQLQLDCISTFAWLLHAQGVPDAAIRLARYVVDHPATVLLTRNHMRKRLAAWSASQPSRLQASAVDLWTLLHRIVAETPAGHASLIESLRKG